MRRSHYTRLVQDEANATAKIEEWTRKVIRAAKQLDKYRQLQQRARRALEKADGELGICSWCGNTKEKCDCPPEIRGERPL